MGMTKKAKHDAAVRRAQAYKDFLHRSNCRLFQAKKLRDEGLVYREIGEQMGVGRERARHLVMKCERYIAKGITTPEMKTDLTIARRKAPY